MFSSLNRNKRSVALNLKSEQDRAAVLRLVETADVVVNNFRPGVMERLGFGYDDLGRINPRIVYAFGTGFGLDGPYAHKGGQDVLAQAMSGAMHRRADPALPLSIYPTTLADYAAGMHLVQGILLALMQREKTGEGQRVAVSLYDSMLAMQMKCWRRAQGRRRRCPCRPRPAGRGRRDHGSRPPGRDGDPRGAGSPAAPPRSRPRLLRGREPP